MDFDFSRLSYRICQPRSSFNEWQKEGPIQGRGKWPRFELRFAPSRKPPFRSADLICHSSRGVPATKNQVNSFNIHLYTLMRKHCC